MDEARRIVQQGFHGGIGIVRADTQTSGRGRIAGRQWIDVPGRSLLMTIILPEGSATFQALPLRVGLGIARALEASAKTALSGTQPPFRLKWPNDILAAWRAPNSASDSAPDSASDNAPNNASASASNSASDHVQEAAGISERSDALHTYGKICGILCETVGGRALAGIGINVRSTTLYAATATIPPISLEEALGALPPLWQNLDSAARVLAVAVLEAIADPTWRLDYETRLWGRGEKLRFLAGHPEHQDIIEGICEGVDDNGSLILSDNRSRRAFASGEIYSH